MSVSDSGERRVQAAQDRLEDRLDEIQRALVDLAREVVQVGTQVGTRVGALEKQSDLLHQALTARDGLVPRVALLEASVERLASDVERALEQRAEGHSEPPGGDLARVELERERSAQARWKALGPLLLASPGIGAAVMQILSWLRGN